MSLRGAKRRSNLGHTCAGTVRALSRRRLLRRFASNKKQGLPLPLWAWAVKRTKPTRGGNETYEFPHPPGRSCKGRGNLHALRHFIKRRLGRCRRWSTGNDLRRAPIALLRTRDNPLGNRSRPMADSTREAGNNTLAGRNSRAANTSPSRHTSHRASPSRRANRPNRRRANHPNHHRRANRPNRRRANRRRHHASRRHHHHANRRRRHLAVHVQKRMAMPTCRRERRQQPNSKALTVVFAWQASHHLH
jgi:hypothetical protein